MRATKKKTRKKATPRTKADVAKANGNTMPEYCATVGDFRDDDGNNHDVIAFYTRGYRLLSMGYGKAKNILECSDSLVAFVEACEGKSARK